MPLHELLIHWAARLSSSFSPAKDRASRAGLIYKLPICKCPSSWGSLCSVTCTQTDCADEHFVTHLALFPLDSEGLPIFTLGYTTLMMAMPKYGLQFNHQVNAHHEGADMHLCRASFLYTPLAVLKIEDSSTAPGHMVFAWSPWILSANQHQTFSDRQLFHGTIQLAHAITWHSLWAWLWLCLRMWLLWCQDFSFLHLWSFFDSFIFLSNSFKSIKPACATATDKCSLSRPQILWKFAIGKAKTNSLSQCCGRQYSTLQVSPGSSSWST